VIRSLCFLLFLFPLVVSAQDLIPEVPAAVLLDQTSGRVLYQKLPDRPFPPASLTKLMTLHLAWEALGTQKVQASDLVPVTDKTSGKAVPPGSSLMFLEAGQRVSFKDLMLGLAVVSGNDAGMTLAYFLGGSQEGFVMQMNAAAQAQGLTSTVFFDSYGYDSRNRTTAADFAKFCRFYLQAHPQSVQVLHNQRQFSYPLTENQAPGDHRKLNTITQPNRNTLLGAYAGADGLKTGYIEESGYNLAATALRGDQRLVVVLLGVQANDALEGGRLRTAAGARLFDFGFSTYPLRALPMPELKPLRVWYSDPGTVLVAPNGPTVYPLAQEEAAGIEVRVEGTLDAIGPLASGTIVGKVIWSRGSRDFYSITLKTVNPAPSAPWWTGLWDAIVLFFRGLTGTPEPTRFGNHT